MSFTVCELLLQNNVYLKKERKINTTAHPAHYTPICQIHIAPSPEASIYLLFSIPPTLNTRLGQRSLSFLTNTLTHPLSAHCALKGGGGKMRAALGAQAQPLHGGPVPHWQERTLSPVPAELSRRRDASAIPLGQGAGGPARLLGPLRWGRRHSPPVSAAGQIRFQLHRHTSWWQGGDRKKPPSPPQPGWCTPAQAFRIPRL